MKDHMRDFAERHLLMLEKAHQSDTEELTRKTSVQQAEIMHLQSLCNSQCTKISSQQSVIASLESSIAQLQEQIQACRYEEELKIPCPPLLVSHIATLSGRAHSINDLLLSEDGNKLYSASDGTTITVWDTL
jgi:WD40 repeat protein